MIRSDTLPRRAFPLATTLIMACLNLAPPLAAADTTPPAGEFTKPVIDIGIVVKDSDQAAKFYTDAIGFKEVTGFDVTADLGRKIGLIDGHATKVRVFVLGEGDLATRIKLLSFPAAPGRAPDQTFIHSTLGIRYLTLYVSNMNRALERLKKANVKLLGETPLDLGGGTLISVVRDPDGNFVELIGRAQ
jgi:catechol 2,3-dioxygenase-like lactoylglutathione lyase family enzyme